MIGVDTLCGVLSSSVLGEKGELASCRLLLGWNWMAWETVPPSTSVAPGSICSVPLPLTLLSASCCSPSVKSAAASIVPLFRMPPAPPVTVPLPTSAPPASIWTVCAASEPLKNALPLSITSSVPPTVRLAVL